MPKIIIVTPIYINHESLYPIVQKFFDTLKENYPTLPVVVVDDASILHHEFPVTLLNKENRGYTYTINRGMEYAFLKEQADIVIVMNDDLEIIPNSLDALCEITGLTIASPRDTAADDTDSFGSIFALTRETYQLLGGFDEKYRHFYSDKDYQQRAYANGVAVIKIRDVVIPHHESATYKFTEKKQLLERDAQIFYYESKGN